MLHCHLLDDKEIAYATSQALPRLAGGLTWEVEKVELYHHPIQRLLELGAVGIPGLSRTTAEEKAALLPLIHQGKEGMGLCTKHLFPSCYRCGSFL